MVQKSRLRGYRDHFFMKGDRILYYRGFTPFGLLFQIGRIL
ncbi:hypothetical protein HMPREF9374_1461 [Desmospora sp. 8437]|nr:hypothetical protein HMPREF9374_1461 [Desmospora sp. 8437]